jgi:hypothetical protein
LRLVVVKLDGIIIRRDALPRPRHELKRPKRFRTLLGVTVDVVDSRGDRAGAQIVIRATERLQFGELKPFGKLI